MNFELTREQQMFREVVHDFAEREVRPRSSVTSATIRNVPVRSGVIATVASPFAPVSPLSVVMSVSRGSLL